MYNPTIPEGKQINNIYVVEKENGWYIQSDFPVTSEIYISHSEWGSMSQSPGYLDIGENEVFISDRLSPLNTTIQIYGIGFTIQEADAEELQQCEDDTYIYKIK